MPGRCYYRSLIFLWRLRTLYILFEYIYLLADFGDSRQIVCNLPSERVKTLRTRMLTLCFEARETVIKKHINCIAE